MSISLPPPPPVHLCPSHFNPRTPFPALHLTSGPLASSVAFSLQTEGSSGATEKMKKGLSDFLGVISDTFAPSPDKTIDCDVITLMGTPSGTAEPYDGTKVFTGGFSCGCPMTPGFQPELTKAIMFIKKKYMCIVKLENTDKQDSYV